MCQYGALVESKDGDPEDIGSRPPCVIQLFAGMARQE